MRAREAGDERREGQQEQNGRHVPPPRSASCDLAENREVREADRVPSAPPLQHDVEPGEQRQREQREERPGTLEGHRPIPAQSACTWTTALTRSETSAPTTTADAAAAHGPPDGDRRRDGRSRRGLRVEADRMRGADEPFVARAALRTARRPAGEGVHRPHAPYERTPRREHCGSQRDHRGRTTATARRGDAPDVRTERRHLARDARVEAVEDGGGRGRDPGVDGAPELPRKGHVDRAVAELGIEPADDVAARARDLVLHVPRRRDDHPGPRNRDAHHQAAALVRRARLPRAREHRDGARKQHDRAPHGTLLNHAVESAAPTSRNIAAPAEK